MRSRNRGGCQLDPHDPHGRRDPRDPTEGLTTLSALRTESTSRLQDHLDDLSPADQETLAEAVPILRGLADRRLTTNDEPT